MITKTEKHTVIDYTVCGTIENFTDYKDFIADLEKARPGDLINVYLNSPGGRVDIGMLLVDAIQNCKGDIAMHIIYPCYSMGAILALCGKSLTMNDDTFLMFHDYSSLSYGKGNDIFSKCSAFNKVFHSKFRKLCKPFLTERECQEILSGKDFYLHNDDESIIKRKERHFKR